MSALLAVQDSPHSPNSFGDLWTDRFPGIAGKLFQAAQHHKLLRWLTARAVMQFAQKLQVAWLANFEQQILAQLWADQLTEVPT